MLITERQRLGEILTRTAEALDIPSHVYEDATLKYEEVGAWLAAEDSELKDHAPEIYPQGSFRLGTVVRPISDALEYDIDLVCHLNLKKEQTTQKELRQMVGERLKKHNEIKKIIKPSRRCWILDYPNSANMPRFHMDVLPAIPNVERPPTGILLADTELTLWQKSNPICYADWFYERMKVILAQRRATFAEAIKASIEEVREWQVKTPLQIAIQILKRHRDIYFQASPDDRPVSIIITTLAAHAYGNQADIYDAFTDIVRDMPRFIEYENGRWRVANPVDPDENFADKWNEQPQRQRAFISWLTKVRDDFAQVARTRTMDEAVDSLKASFGERIMAGVAADVGLKARPGPLATLPAKVAALADISHCQSPLWRIEQKYQAKVSGSVHFREYGKKLWPLADRSVPKDLWLRFALTTNTPAPYNVQWQVVNTGKEAIEARQLRGDFYPSDSTNKAIRWESTRYHGTHWIEAFVIKDGICVARSGRTLVKIR